MPNAPPPTRGGNWLRQTRRVQKANMAREGRRITVCQHSLLWILRTPWHLGPWVVIKNMGVQNSREEPTLRTTTFIIHKTPRGGRSSAAELDGGVREAVWTEQYLMIQGLLRRTPGGGRVLVWPSGRPPLRPATTMWGSRAFPPQSSEHLVSILAWKIRGKPDKKHVFFVGLEVFKWPEA